MIRAFFLLSFWIMLLPSLFARGTLTVNSTSSNLEEGRTYTFRFDYVQTEGTDLTKDITSLSFNSIYNADVSIPLGGTATFSFRNGYAKLDMERTSETDLEINGKSYPLAMGQHHFDIIVRESFLYLWIDSDTLQTPLVVLDSLYRSEGVADFTTTGGASISNSHLHVDYAYGLRFAFHVPNGTKVPDVKKTNNQMTVVYYAKMTLPPMLYNSTPNADGTILYCDLNPTPMNQPIPYGTIYTFQWDETIGSCSDSLANQVVVELYGHDNETLSFSKTYPCGENTCPIDTAYIEPDSYCLGGNSVLFVRSNVSASDLTYEWKKNSLNFQNTETDSLVVDIDADYQVKVIDKMDATCNFESPVFTLKRFEAPVVSLRDTFDVESPVTLCPVKKSDAGKYTYRWSTGAETASIVAKNAGNYKVRVFNGDCEVDASTYVRFSVMIDFPKVLSPNGDGVNDVFQSAYIRDKYPDATIKIFNRFGKQLSAYKASDEGWNGTYLGREMPSGDYWYEAYIPVLDKYYTGHFTLMRQ